MTAPDPRLDDIQARAASVASVVGNHDAMGPRFRDKALHLADEDVPYLLTELRKAREALERVEAECSATDAETEEALQADLVTRIRAAVAAAKGDEQ